MTKIRPISGPRGLLSPTVENWFCYLYLAVYTYLIPRFNPLPTSLLTLATGCGLLLLIGRAPVYLNVYRGKPRRILAGFAAIILAPIPIAYLYSGNNPDVLFIGAVFLIALIAAKGAITRNPRGFENLLIAYGVILTLSMFWFLTMYFSDPLYNFHLFLYQETDPHILYTRQRSGLTQDLHTFGYHLVVLSMFLITGCIASQHKRRLLFVFLTICTGVVVILMGERSVIVAIGAGVFALALKSRYRIGKLSVGLVLAAIFASMILWHNPAEWKGGSVQLDVLSKITSDEMRSEVSDRFRLQWEGILVMVDYPLGLALVGKDWVDVMASRNYSLFDTWGRIIGVHNGYLGTAIAYGLPMFLLIIFVLCKLVSLALNLLSVRNADGQTDWSCAAMGSALIASLTQALFHNASFVTLESSSVIVVFLSMAAYSRRFYIQKRTNFR